jgi:hypothetical protein
MIAVEAQDLQRRVIGPSMILQVPIDRVADAPSMFAATAIHMIEAEEFGGGLAAAYTDGAAVCIECIELISFAARSSCLGITSTAPRTQSITPASYGKEIRGRLRPSALGASFHSTPRAVRANSILLD